MGDRFVARWGIVPGKSCGGGDALMCRNIDKRAFMDHARHRQESFCANFEPYTAALPSRHPANWAKWKIRRMAAGSAVSMGPRGQGSIPGRSVRMVWEWRDQGRVCEDIMIVFHPMAYAMVCMMISVNGRLLERVPGGRWELHWPGQQRLCRFIEGRRKGDGGAFRKPAGAATAGRVCFRQTRSREPRTPSRPVPRSSCAAA